MSTVKAYYTDDMVTLYHGDCIEVMQGMAEASVDAIVTDPPYGLEFMGKDWDAPWKVSGDVETANEGTDTSHPFRDGTQRVRYGMGDMIGFQSWCNDWAVEALRVLKPGGHMLAFGGTRTWHRLACAIEDSGFEIRDSIAWMYGSGFPKSLDVSKAIDKSAGAERVTKRVPYSTNVMQQGIGVERPWMTRAAAAGFHDLAGDEPATPEAVRWQGWGTALKPAFEPIVVARKPLIGTVAANVLEYGTGALNVDGCRIGTNGEVLSTPQSDPHKRGAGAGEYAISTRDIDRMHAAQAASIERTNTLGRWPANVILDESQADKLGDESRFFYTAKASTVERPRIDGSAHPTVKPLDLMRYLVRLVTPPGGLVLEPFAGSGTTAEACIVEGFKCIAIEREAEYLPLIVQRVSKPIQVTLL